jgi:CheY-like chemotaxis protein
MLERLGGYSMRTSLPLEVLEVLEAPALRLQIPDIGWPGGLQDHSTEVVKGPAYPQDNSHHRLCPERRQMETCIAAGMEYYLAKPVKKEELREALSRCCSKEIQSRSSGAAEAISK